VAVDPVTAAPIAPVAPAAKTYTRADISRAGAALCSKGQMQNLISLLRDKYGAMAIPAVPEERLSELAVDLIALGADL
jgi:hypothetical protein